MLILSPTRELAQQTAAVMAEASSQCGLRALCVYGGVPKPPQVGTRALLRPARRSCRLCVRQLASAPAVKVTAWLCLLGSFLSCCIPTSGPLPKRWIATALLAALLLHPHRPSQAACRQRRWEQGGNMLAADRAALGGLIAGRQGRQRAVSYLQAKALRKGIDVLVATPGRLEDLVQDTACRLSDISYLVLDEADRMLDLGFEPHIRQACLRCL